MRLTRAYICELPVYVHDSVVSIDHAHQMEGGSKAIVAIPRL